MSGDFISNTSTSLDAVLRDRAVFSVDRKHGYTMEFAPSSAQHRLDYDEETERLTSAVLSHQLLPRPRVRSMCISCGEVIPCIKIEARAPLARAAIVFDAERNIHAPVDYEPDGPMSEICRACLKSDFGTVAHYLLGSL
jgi:hypothetical protein